MEKNRTKRGLILAALVSSVILSEGCVANSPSKRLEIFPREIQQESSYQANSKYRVAYIPLIKFEF
jgi:hypothetical protein